MTKANANTNVVANGLPMSLEQMRSYLQESYGIPIVLREEGKTTVECPYCAKEHDHDPAPGHYKPACEPSPGRGLVIGERSFVPAYGYKVMEYREEEGINTLIVPDDEIGK